MNTEKLDAEYIETRDAELKEAVKPVLDWLYKYGNPYVNVIINMAETNVADSFMHTLENEIRD